MTEGREQKTCINCRFFEGLAVLETFHVCHNPHLRVDTCGDTECYYSFQPPSIDFGCTLFEPNP